MSVFGEADVLRMIKEGDEFGALDAEEILKLWVPNARRRFMAIDKSLCGFLAEVQKVFPDAQYYTASGGFNLMLGRSHGSREFGTGEGGTQQQLIALSGKASIGDGDF